MKFKENVKFLLGLIALSIIISVPFLPTIQKIISIPNEIITLNNNSPIELPNLGQSVKANAHNSMKKENPTTFTKRHNGKGIISYDLAGIPIKKVNVSVKDDLQLIPGGQSIGVQLQTKGVLVVGHHLVNGDDDQTSPGEKAEVKVGDVILEIDGNEIKNMKDVKPLVDTAGDNNDTLKLQIKRGEKIIQTNLKPVLDKKDDRYRIGLYIRDSAAGIGTMSFYEPNSKKYGALGHVISDMDTKKPIEINQGKIVRSQVTSIEKGNNGTPGEKQARFSLKDKEIGSITKNSPFGIFGKLNQGLANDINDQPMSIALPHEVKEGPAKIYTVVEGEEIEEFSVEIVSSTLQKSPATKGMVIKITDEDLLERTGGIVQGMSGSPIIQDNKIIGAITHVFVNDPTSGYGIHVEWMLQEAGIDIYNEKKKKQAS